MTTEHLYPVILAGGVGSRLWPRSRQSSPKQFLDLTGGDLSMLQEAFARITPLVPTHHIYVITNAEYVDTVCEQLPEIPRANVLGEPAARGSAAAIGLTAITLQRRDPDASMAVLTADHLIGKPASLRDVLIGATALAQEGHLITLGIRPDYPETGYGYIEMGEFLGAYNGQEARSVLSFREKPDRKTAESFLATGNYAWNSGMFVWRVDSIMAEFERQMPSLYLALMHIAAALDTESEDQAFADWWLPLAGNVTIDFGVMEGAEKVTVFPVSIDWSDVGSWAALLDLMEKDEQGNVVKGQHLGHDTRNTFIFSKNRFIATIGLQDMIIVDTDDVVLVMPADRAQEVKRLHEILKAKGLERLLA